MVQSSPTFYHGLICNRLKCITVFNLVIGMQAGEHGGGLRSTRFAVLLAGTFISLSWRPAGFFEVVSQAWSLPRQGGLWITLHARKPDFCLPSVRGAAYCCLLGLLYLSWGLQNPAGRSGWAAAPCDPAGCSRNVGNALIWVSVLRCYRLDIGKNISSERVVMHWNGLIGEEVESPSLEWFQNCGDVAVRDMVSGHGADGLGLDLGIWEVFSSLHDFTIWH